MEYKPTTLERDYMDGKLTYIEKNNSPKEQVRLFRQDWKTKDRKSINDLLKYGYYDYTYNNEEI